jgi:hypothetical protein
MPRKRLGGLCDPGETLVARKEGVGECQAETSDNETITVVRARPYCPTINGRRWCPAGIAPSVQALMRQRDQVSVRRSALRQLDRDLRPD